MDAPSVPRGMRSMSPESLIQQITKSIVTLTLVVVGIVFLFKTSKIWNTKLDEITKAAEDKKKEEKEALDRNWAENMGKDLSKYKSCKDLDPKKCIEDALGMPIVYTMSSEDLRMVPIDTPFQKINLTSEDTWISRGS